MEICEITTKTTSKPLTLDETPEKFGSLQQPEGGNDICSSADIQCTEG